MSEINENSLPLSVIDAAEEAFYDAQGMYGTDAGVRNAAWVGFVAGVKSAGGSLADAVAQVRREQT